MMNAHTVGSRYEDTRKLDIAQIAKLIRQDIKAQVKGGQLPKATYSVRISRYSGGQSLSVTVSDVPFVIVNRARIAQEVARPHAHADEAIYTPVAAAIVERVEALIAEYNFNDSDSQTDYFHVRFYGSVRFDYEQERRQRQAIRQQLGAEAGR